MSSSEPLLEESAVSVPTSLRESVGEDDHTPLYIVFFVFGASILIPWNAEITLTEYFKYRLVGGFFERSFLSWLSVANMIANLYFLREANKTNLSAEMPERLHRSLWFILAGVGLFLVSTIFSSVNPDVFFVFLILNAVLLAGSAAYCQNAAVALASRFGSRYMQALFSGQGAIAVLVGAVQFVSAYVTLRSRSLHPSQPLEDSDGEADAIAFRFFVAAFVFTGACLGVSYYFSCRYADLVRHWHGISSIQDSRPIEALVHRKVRLLAFAIFTVFAVTLAVFPALTAIVESVNPYDPDSPAFWDLVRRQDLFVPLGVVVFAVGDWVGRLLPSFRIFATSNDRILACASAARVVFVVLFLLCNVSPPEVPVIKSDTLFFVIMLLFAVTNGLVSTLTMIAVHHKDDITQSEEDLASNVLGYYLVLGLTAGSFLSFFVRALQCKCNPFT